MKNEKDKMVLIDGNSIMNRAFYGIMSSKMLMAKDGIYTNAIYGFLSILYKIIEDIEPKYLVVTFDLKAPTFRKLLDPEYKANRSGMPDELRAQMPVVKDILRAMNIDIVEKEGYEADDVLGTLSKYGEEKGLAVTILSGDRDTFQLATDNVTIRIPRTKAGKTEVEEFNRTKIIETYELEPKQLIEVKGLQGDTGDNIKGVPGIGEKTALALIKKFGSIEELYKKVEAGEDGLKGKQRENIVNNKELAMQSRQLGEICLTVPIEDTLEQFKVEEWDNTKVLELFEKLNFKKYIEKFNLNNVASSQKETNSEEKYSLEELNILELKEKVKNEKELIIYFELNTETDEVQNKEKIIKEKIESVSIYNKEKNRVYYTKLNCEKDILELKEILENENIKKVSINLGKIYVVLRQIGIELQGMSFDVHIAGYLINPEDNKLNLEILAKKYLDRDISIKEEIKECTQLNLFENMNDEDESQKEQEEINKKENLALRVKTIKDLKDVTFKEMEKDNLLQLFNEIEMPTVLVLADMQFNGINVDVEELNKLSKELSTEIEKLNAKIIELAGTEFNVNSPKQLGEILFEKLKLPVIKKTKSGYSTDVEVLEKLESEHEIIGKILKYRQYAKLNSTYAQGLKQHINSKTNKIHSTFNQTITATGRISSTEPNLQNIPTRSELGKKIRKAFKADEDKIYIDADYSQIELRVMAHISEDESMVHAFNNNEDIHKQAASKVFKTPIEEVTKEQRSNAKAVNFGIVYGISDFGLGEQLGVSRNVAKQYIDEYFEEYPGIQNFMQNIVSKAKETGVVTTLYNRRRYVEQIRSTNFNIRQFGKRIAINTPIQGTAADIMKIAMINVYKKLKEENMKAKIVLQVHDEMMIESPKDEEEKVKKIIKREMENVIKLEVPLLAEVSCAKSWDECK